MPIYEYKCTQCGAVEERHEPVGSAISHSCPECGGEAQRVFSTFTFVMSNKKRKKELTGWRKRVF